MMLKRLRVWYLAAAASAAFAAPALAAEGAPPRQVDWPWQGVFGAYDRAALQRGLQVYKEVCAICHGLDRVAYRHLEALGYTEDQVRAFAAEYEVQNEEPDDQGEMFMRPARPSDQFVNPYANEQAARAANNGAFPPDLSLIVKGREGGANYIYSLLVGYTEPPPGVEVMEGLHYNTYFPGNWNAMPPPLSDGQVSYADGTNATVDQMARDVTSFLAWTASPDLEDRKRTGVKVMLFLVVFTGLLVAVKRRIWSDVPH